MACRKGKEGLRGRQYELNTELKGGHFQESPSVGSVTWKGGHRRLRTEKGVLTLGP